MAFAHNIDYRTQCVPKAATVESAHMPRTAVILVASAAVLSHLWVLTLPFKLDDVAQIPRAADKLQDELSAIVPGISGPEEPVMEHDRHRFRPLLWGLFMTESALDGQPVRSLLFHVVSLAIHAACSVLLVLVLRRHLPIGAAAGAGLFFAVNGAGSQAISWIAARPDLLVTLWGLSALAVAQGGSGAVTTRRALVVGAFLAAAVLSKVSGVVVVAAVLFIGFLGRDRRLGPWLTALAAPALCWFWRGLYLGTWAPSYTSGRSALDADVTGNLLSMPAVFVDCLVPWWQPSNGNVRELWAERALSFLDGAAAPVLAAVILLGAVLGVLRLDTNGRRCVLISGFVAVLLAAPLTFLYAPASLPIISRSFYPLMAAVSPVLGVGLRAGVVAARRRRPWLLIPAVLALLIQVDSVFTISAAERAAGERINAQVHAITDHRRLNILIGRELYDHGAVMLGNMTHLRLRPPFHPVRVPLIALDSTAELMSSGLLSDRPGPVSVFALTEGPPHVRRIVDYPPNGRAPLPALRPDGGSWVPVRPVTTREVVAVRVSVKDQTPRKVVLQTSSSGIARELPRGSGILLLSEDVGWVLGGELRSLRVTPDADSVTLLSEMPEVEALAPDANHPWPGGPLLFRFRGHIRGLIQGLPDPHLHLQFTPKDTGGVVSYEAMDADLTHASLPGLKLATIPKLFQEHGAPVGMTDLRLQWRVELLDEQGAVIALSPWRSLIYRP